MQLPICVVIERRIYRAQSCTGGGGGEGGSISLTRQWHVNIILLEGTFTSWAIANLYTGFKN